MGLGNPGPQYQNTRHNVGFWLVRSLAEKYAGKFTPEPKFKGSTGSINVAGLDCRLLLPETFMNLSGEAVGKVVRFYKIPIASVLVIHDELDFPPGVIRLKKGGGANGHHGVQNIIDQLGDNDFWRLRVGIGKADSKDDTINHVLEIPSKSEIIQIHNAIERVLTIVPKLVKGDFDVAMLELHVV